MFASVMDHLRWSWIIELLFQFIHLISLQNHSHLCISLSLRIRKMLQIIVKHLSTSLLNTEKKLWKLLLHKDFLTIYKNHKRQPKGFNIKFNLSWRANNKHLQRFCKSILNKTSRNILKKVIKAVNIDIHHLKRKQKQLKTELYYSVTQWA